MPARKSAPELFAALYGIDSGMHRKKYASYGRTAVTGKIFFTTRGAADHILPAVGSE